MIAKAAHLNQQTTGAIIRTTDLVHRETAAAIKLHPRKQRFVFGMSRRLRTKDGSVQHVCSDGIMLHLVAGLQASYLWARSQKYIG